MLDERDLDIEVRRYLDDPPTADELDALLERLEMQPRQLMRQKEEEYDELGLDDEEKSRDELIGAMVDHPILIQRPVVLRGDRAALGRPPSDVLSLFDD
jgi:arsenate reductase